MQANPEKQKRVDLRNELKKKIKHENIEDFNNFVRSMILALLGNVDGDNNALYTTVYDRIFTYLKNLPDTIKLRMLNNSKLHNQIIESDKILHDAIIEINKSELVSLKRLFDDFLVNIGILQGLVFLQGVYNIEIGVELDIDDNGDHDNEIDKINLNHGTQIQNLHNHYIEIINQFMTAVNGKLNLVNSVISKNLNDSGNRVNVTGNSGISGASKFSSATARVTVNQPDRQTDDENKDADTNVNTNVNANAKRQKKGKGTGTFPNISSNTGSNTGKGTDFAGGSYNPYKVKHLKYKLKSEIVTANLKIMAIKSKSPNLFY